MPSWRLQLKQHQQANCPQTYLHRDRLAVSPVLKLEEKNQKKLQAARQKKEQEEQREQKKLEAERQKKEREEQQEQKRENEAKKNEAARKKQERDKQRLLNKNKGRHKVHGVHILGTVLARTTCIWVFMCEESVLYAHVLLPWHIILYFSISMCMYMYVHIYMYASMSYFGIHLHYPCTPQCVSMYANNNSNLRAAMLITCMCFL